MSTFCISLVDIPIEVNASFEATKDFCKKYLTEEAPLFSVTLTQTDIEAMREQAVKTALAEGRIPTEHAESYLERIALARVVLGKLIDYDILLFHGAVMAVGGKAYMFTAESGTGKTTHCELWLKNIPDCHILNGDKPLLLFKDGRVRACGSPWQGKENYGVNESFPLEAVCILERDVKNHIEETTMGDCLPVFMSSCHIPSGRGNILTVFNLFKQLSTVRFYRLGCNMEDEAALVSYHGMVRE